MTTPGSGELFMDVVIVVLALLAPKIGALGDALGSLWRRGRSTDSDGQRPAR